ncbi:16881_t:CDS:2 [Acaulospora colombiana]|uniref:16881_t:CDS:1 n=1 Tax=Acaulospora colombiana TaxID=27376 RepID=A0ACA9JXU4_9GLOM|nr:16881_t:CDS:2 [Acaulospora colombiana]
MKFSHSIQFNSVPDWAEHYIAYSNLKKLIYQIERDLLTIATSEDDAESHTEISPLVDSRARANAIFIPALDKELVKIDSFYLGKEKELFEEVDTLIQDFAVFENLEDNVSIHSNSMGFSRSYQSSEGINTLGRSRLSSDDEERVAPNRFSIGSEPFNSSEDRRMSFIWGPPSIEDQRIHMKKRTIELFVWLSELKSFVSLNHTGFSKILKKYDKVTDGNLKGSYMSNVVSAAYPFRPSSKKTLEEKMLKVQEIYAHLCTNGDMDVAMRELKTHLREFIIWERNTIWRDIIGLERKSHAVGIKAPVTVDKLVESGSKIRTPFGKLTVSDTFWRDAFLLTLCIAVFFVLLNVNLFKKEEQRNCFALLVFASLLWSTEVIPLFVTSLLIPLMVVCLGVLRTDEAPRQRLVAVNAAKHIFSAMFSPVIMLLLGGFSIAGALSKYHVAKIMATYVLSKAGTKPHFVLLANMFVATFASMWISNVAAPVLCLSLVQPILRNLPPNSSFSRCLLLGIALASNVGGMASPISSPQNIIAIKNMEPSPTWVQWFVVAIPLCIVIDLFIWLLLLWNYNPSKNSPKIHPIRSTRDPLTGVQIFVIAVTVGTIVLWCIERTEAVENFFGDMGIIAIIPLVLFFGTGVLTKEDFNNFLWTVIVLAMGGIALGNAVQSSGLLHTIAKDIQMMGSALMCSVAMGLPVSGFPNMNVIMMEDEMGVRYLSTYDFIKSDAPAKQIQATKSHVEGDFKDPNKIRELAQRADILTIEIEHVNADVLEILSKENVVIHPSPSTIRLIQDKYAQKVHLSNNNIPVVEFLEVPSRQELIEAASRFGYPLMLKSKTLAYDGRGNYVIRSEDDIKAALEALGNHKTPLYAERWAPFIKELAVMVVRRANGEVRSYPVVETVHRENICHLVVAPAQVNGLLLEKAREMAERTIRTLDGAGVFGVEMFLMSDGSIYVNEIAPRPHNSGHYTIEACETSQYENHLRSILDIPLGSTALKVSTAAMINILGKSEDIQECLRPCTKALTIPGVTIHLYGKKECRKGRKMGHITTVANSIPQLFERIEPIIKVIDESDTSIPYTTIQPLVGIIMGSDSDLPTMKACAEILESFDVPFELSIVSAHRTPLRMVEYAKNAHKRGIKVIVAGAGGAAHLPGMVAALTPLPVIGVPVKGKILDGVDSLYSIVQMPRGVPVATVAINNSTNAGLLAVRQLGAFIPNYLERMEQFMKKQENEVLAKVDRLEEVGWKMY